MVSFNLNYDTYEVKIFIGGELYRTYVNIDREVPEELIDQIIERNANEFIQERKRIEYKRRSLFD